MQIHNLKVRFNLDRPEHARALDQLRNMEGSMTANIIRAVNAYGKELSAEAAREQMLTEIRQIVRDEFSRFYDGVAPAENPEQPKPAIITDPSTLSTAAAFLTAISEGN